MPEVSESELTIIENALVTIREAINEDNSPQAAEIKKIVMEAEQIVSGKLDEGGNDASPGATSGVPESQVLAGAAAGEGGAMSMDDANKMMSMMQEMMSMMQKAMGPMMGGQEMTMEQCMASGKTQEECQAMMQQQKSAMPPIPA